MQIDEPTLCVFNEVTAQLATNDASAHEQAVARFHALGKDRGGLLFRFLHDKGASRRRRDPVILLVACISAALAVKTIMGALKPHVPIPVLGCCFILIGVLAVSALNATVSRLILPGTRSQYHMAASHLMDTVNDMECLPSMIEALDYGDRNSTIIAAAAYIQISRPDDRGRH